MKHIRVVGLAVTIWVLAACGGTPEVPLAGPANDDLAVTADNNDPSDDADGNATNNESAPDDAGSAEDNSDSSEAIDAGSSDSDPKVESATDTELDTEKPDGTCTAQNDFPQLAKAVVQVAADVDNDGADDEVLAFFEPTGSDNRQVWLQVNFAKGGVATGQWGTVRELPTVPDIRVFDLTDLDAPIDPKELIVKIGSGASHELWGVATLVDCSLVPTTYEGEPFFFANGASAGHSTTAGCDYGTGGKIEFSVTSQDFNEQTWETDTFKLVGSVWTAIGSSNHTDFPGLDEFYVSGLNDCI